jgi:hypothetical protein
MVNKSLAQQESEQQRMLATREKRGAGSPGPGDAASPQSRLLNVFLGRWTVGGRQLEGPVGPAADVRAESTYEWLSGGHYLIHRFDGHVGDDTAACIELIHHDASRGTYRCETFYDRGQRKDWEVTESGGTWTWSGDWEMGGTTMRVRCTSVFSDDGRTLTARWEHSPDGHNWQPFWELEAERVG